METQRNLGDGDIWIPLAFIASGMMAWCMHGVLSSSLHSSREDRDLRERLSKVEKAVLSDPNNINESVVRDSNTYDPNSFPIKKENVFGEETPEEFFEVYSESRKERGYISIDGKPIKDKFKEIGVSINPNSSSKHKILIESQFYSKHSGRLLIEKEEKHTGYLTVNGKPVETYFPKIPEKTRK